jgi:bifunctional UDP-N-acetylglucosamine pyrophosphorylase/glucosamine-1-phosphate N-acetyltransferase
MKNIAVVVLAAGKGKRMKSDLAKVLHPVFGRPMIEQLLKTLSKMKFDRTIIVIGHQADKVKSTLSTYGDKLEFILQKRQLGTGHATMVCEEALSQFRGEILVLAGDVPFLSSETITSLIKTHQQEKAAATVLSSIPPDPTGYGRIVRVPGTDLVDKIVEHKDASEKEREIKEINTGTFCFDSSRLFDALHEVKDDNLQKEYYLTDVMEILRRKELKTAVYLTKDADEVLGINSLEQLTDLEARFAKRIGINEPFS